MRRHPQRRLAIGVLGIPPRLCWHESGPASRPPYAAMPQRCLAVAVFAKNQIGIAFEQRLNLFQVTGFGCVMNLATEGGATKQCSEQQQ